ncbi:MAG: hypothetical protein ACE5OS_09145 [Anaerolineae bacterium]
MPECIVCKGYYSSGTVCPRCQTDNTPWELWQQASPEERGGWGLLFFMEPHFYIPLVITAAALFFGVLGIAGLWIGLNLAIRLLATVATVAGCLVVIQSVYEGRHRLRESELLKQWRTARRRMRPRIRLSAQLKTILVPVMAMGLILLLTYALVKSEDLWGLANRLLFEREEAPEETPEEEAPIAEQEAPPEQELPPPPSPDILERVKRAIPLISLIGYVGLSLSLTYSSSMASARRYVGCMNQVLPCPIFLQDEKLAQIVRREAEVELGRLDPKGANPIGLMGYIEFEGQTDQQILRLSPSVDLSTTVGVPLSPQVELWGQAATWVWDELVRTDDGGIEIKVARQEIYQLPQSTQGTGRRPNPRVSYIVRADAWGRITEIKRDTG